MHSIQIQPRLAETDAMGHINNAVIPVWFEHGRQIIFDSVNPSRSLQELPLILAKISIDYLIQIYMQHEVTIRTSILKFGNTSFTVKQEAWQQKKLAATGESVMVYFDYKTNKPLPLTPEIKSRLSSLLAEE